ncbi:fumarylacetoacetate hydrolase family protein [Pseudomonas sp. ZM23]|uniref:Fumarylacetoacetate hydrolase family protein n=1 Tax=Pseudomonas triclosanedens TaxID=2961893 RepID=A0ABY6ZST2_9PSED|nr:fumarylacetoacetate hydrolase family protein [Pseudomonas triclosanedens]MCP8467632.1 fumarylacetoacetate hydrolase family protein [Pseudomonas triclosanedens]MCP8473378.1 fumarylacetoacetate hydrolase family protein [Pseudomonas triclosanedens]MCP8479407.1 fumarylacetoacetate hydrolase family protein [Pseudomonas triclosanedens]WAI47100.1 fumarylacetoacetate hydrolase family protein [Pseudomonas triclosanedens]
MPVHVVRFEHQNETRWGVIRQGRITPLPGNFASTGDLIRQVRAEDLIDLRGDELAVESVKLLSPVTRDQQFVCQGANYRQHMIESGMDPDAKHFNMIFTKAQSCIVAADSDLIKPRQVRFLDYEIELGLVLRREITGKVTVNDANLHEFIAGVVIVNDYSARDIQIPQMQFYKGKSFRTFGPVGPYLCLLQKNDMRYLKDLQLRLTVNGEVRQNDSTANLVHGPAETLSELSGVQDFAAGDLIATGTPAGCALSIPSPAKQRIAALLPERVKWQAFLKAQAQRPQYLKAGDLVEASIRSADGAIDLGVQRNRVVEQA